MRALAPVAMLLLAGCLGAASDPAPADAAPPALAWTDAVVALAPVPRPANCCYEPTVAVDSSGRTYVTEMVWTRLAASDDGVTFREIPVPPPVLNGDLMVQVDARDRVYVSSLHPLGVALARSDDGGATWPVRTLVPTLADGAEDSTDRQWLAFGEGDVVYVTYQENCRAMGGDGTLCQDDRGTRVARSDDGGASFGPFVEATPPANTITGQPLVDADGSVLVPHFQIGGGNADLWIARGTPEAGYETFLVHAPPGGAGASFPALVPTDEGLLLAWHGPDDQLLYATSADGGRSWSAPSSLGVELVAAPWAVASAAGPVLSWLEPRDGELVLRQALIAHGVASFEDVGAVGDGFPRTHFAHATATPDGLRHVWATAEGVMVRAWKL